MIAKVQYILVEIKIRSVEEPSILMSCNFIRDEIEVGRITLKKIPTKDNMTDMMTKPLPCTKFSLCVDLVGLASFNM